MKTEKSINFMKLTLQLLALQFPHIAIRYGLGGAFKTLHLVQLSPETELRTNKNLGEACFAICEAFNARFHYEDAIFTAPDSDLSIKEPIITFNKEIDEYERLTGDFPRKLYPSSAVISKKGQVTEEAVI